MKFLYFAEKLDEMASESARNLITAKLADLYKKIDEPEIGNAMYFLIGRIAPTFTPLEFGMSEKSIIKAIHLYMTNESVIMHGDSDDISSIYSKTGDVGSVIQIVRNRFALPDNQLDISWVHGKLLEIAKISGKGSQDLKLEKLSNLFSLLSPVECKYLARIVSGDLRLGLSSKTLLDALSVVLSGDKSRRKLIERAFGVRSDIGSIAKLVLFSDEPEKSLQDVHLLPGIPVASKLVERASGSSEVFERLGSCVLQPKLDGLRAQIHLLAEENDLGRRVEIYSRNMESLTDSFEDLCKAVLELKGVDSIVLDSEAIGFDFETKKYLSYQETMQRRRKYDVEEFSASIPLKAMCFDILYLNGQDLSQTPIEERLSKLESILKKSNVSQLEMLETITVESENQLESYFQSNIKKGLEGIIAKKQGTVYEPGTRNFDWIKLKANTEVSMVDTLDAVVMGYYKGKGSRAKFGIGAILIGIISDDKEKILSIAKVGTGITDDQFALIVSDLENYRLEKKPESYHVAKMLQPDIWVEPKVVVEIIADEITRSPAHFACIGILADGEAQSNISKGLSLRFPRLKVWNRQDKDFLISTSESEVLRMYSIRKISKT